MIYPHYLTTRLCHQSWAEGKWKSSRLSVVLKPLYEKPWRRAHWHCGYPSQTKITENVDCLLLIVASLTVGEPRFDRVDTKCANGTVTKCANRPITKCTNKIEIDIEIELWWMSGPYQIRKLSSNAPTGQSPNSPTNHHQMWQQASKRCRSLTSWGWVPTKFANGANH